MKSLILEKTFEIVEELDSYLLPKNVKYVVLNDIATALYGLVKPFEEVRILVESGREDLVSIAIANIAVTDVSPSRILEGLRRDGIVAVNMLTAPLLVVERARSRLDELVINEAVEERISRYKVRIPTLEGLIARLMQQAEYPYPAMGYTLLVSWIDSIDLDKLVEMIRISKVDFTVFKTALKKIMGIVKNHPTIKPREDLLSAILEKL
ncbi:hypothetical protein ACSU1N_05695 [Thermogladius sp. 4427co]|uniref:hypothetical protein n=1 Tax=Thermogladius sp. 4427co TaxID=3450718 RepID=UPI003F78F89E